MGNKVSLILAWIANILPGLGILLVPERGGFHTLCAIGYIIVGSIAYLGTFVFGIGLLLLLPTQLVACIHSVVLASGYNKSLDSRRADLDQRLSDATESNSQLGDLAN